MAEFTLHKIRLACVPEQVNIPVHIAVEQEIAKKNGIDLEVTLVPEGTGKMIEMLENGVVDIAMTVSDALLVAISKGRKVALNGVYATSPLVWAVATHPKYKELGDSPEALSKFFSDLVANSEQKQARAGISRLGSGSQSMACYLAMLQGFNHQKDLSFHVANNIHGLLEGIQRDSFDFFLWETFTTKPYFDRGDLHKVGEVVTPWPAFCFAVSSELHTRNPILSEAIKENLYKTIYESIQLFTSDLETAAERIVADHKHNLEDARLWLSRIEYNKSIEMTVDRENLQKSVEILKEIGLISSEFSVDTL